MTEVAIYITIDGFLRLATEPHIALFTFLNKLGIKSAPERSTMAIYTNVMPGDYSMVYTFNGEQKVGIVTVPGTISSHIDFKLPKVNKKKRGPSPEEKYSWHTTKQKHSQNTGLKLRLGGRR